MNLANRISIFRIILIPFFISSVVYSRLDIALILFTLAVLSDAFDGFIARSRNQKTQLGVVIDPVADKLLLMSAFICLSLVKAIPQDLRLPPYVTIIVLSRDAILVVGSAVIYMVTGDLKVSPSAIGKVTTFFQMMTIASVLLSFRHSYIVWNIAVALTVLSGVDYIARGSKLFNDNNLNIKKGG